MSAAATSPNRIVKRVSRRSQSGHGDARPHSYPTAPSTARLTPKDILIAAQESPRPTSARHHLTAMRSPPTSTVNTAVKSP
jgi:hypothetical protein